MTASSSVSYTHLDVYKRQLSDRFTDATYAYQAGAKGVDINKMRALEQWVQGVLQPDVTILFLSLIHI